MKVQGTDRPVVVPAADEFVAADRAISAAVSAFQALSMALEWCNESQSIEEWDRRGRPEDKSVMPDEPDCDPDHIAKIVTYARCVSRYDVGTLTESLANIEEQALTLATNYAPEAYFAPALTGGDDA